MNEKVLDSIPFMRIQDLFPWKVHMDTSTSMILSFDFICKLFNDPINCESCDFEVQSFLRSSAQVTILISFYESEFLQTFDSHFELETFF